jgi:hypothetical protein
MRSAACLLLLALAVPPQVAAQTLYAAPAEVAAAVEAASVEAKAYTEAEALIVALQQAQLASSLEPLRAEARLQQLLLRLRETPQSAAGRTAVMALLDHSPRVFTDAVDPEHRGRTRPAFTIAGGARAVLRHWDDRAAVGAYRKALAQADLAALRAAENRRAITALVREADEDALWLLHQADLPQPAARLALFERSGDAAIAQSLLRTAPDTATQQLAVVIARRLAPDQALALLGDAQVHQARRSAARLAIGGLVAQHAAARAHLLATLGDAHGASSATALAHHADDATLAALGDLLAERGDGARTRHALLALRLSTDPRATAQLRAYALDERQPPALRAEVRSWLD